MSNSERNENMRLQHAIGLRSTDGKNVILDDPMYWLNACYRFVMNVLKGVFHINWLGASPQQRYKYLVKVASVLPQVHQYQEIYLPGWVYHPAIAFFLEQYRRDPIAQLPTGLTVHSLIPQGITVADQFRDFVNTLSFEAARQGLRKKIADYEAKLAKNRKRLAKVEKTLFQRCSRVVILRPDLKYRKALYSPDEMHGIAETEQEERDGHRRIYTEGGELEGRELPASRVGFEEVQRDRVKFFANMKGKPSLFRHLIAYVWRLEYGHKTGFHLHLVLAFNGAKVQKHEHLTQMIGEYWVQLTNGRGDFHNCNADWDKNNERYGIGAIEWHDDRLRGNFANHVLPYLAKFDPYILARPYKGCKLMGSGFVHRERPEKRGRPRNLERRLPLLPTQPRV